MATKRLSAEDGNLQTASIVTSRKRNFHDIDLEFDVNGVGELFAKTDAAAVKQAIKTLLLTSRGEKPFDQFFGTNVYSLLFENATANTANDIKSFIENAINNYEPRATIQDVGVNLAPDNNSAAVSVTFILHNYEQPVTFYTTITRLR